MRPSKISSSNKLTEEILALGRQDFSVSDVTSRAKRQ